MEHSLTTPDFLYFKGFPLSYADDDLVFGIKSECGKSDAAVLWRGGLHDSSEAVVIAEMNGCVAGLVLEESLLSAIASSSKQLQTLIIAMTNGGDDVWLSGDGFEWLSQHKNNQVHTTFKTSSKVQIFINDAFSSSTDGVLVSPPEVVLSILSAINRFKEDRHLCSVLFKVQPGSSWIDSVASLDGVMSLANDSALLHRLSRIFAGRVL